mgnify:CR=1 FL=1
MNTSKVEICGVNTALLPVLNEEQKTQLLLAAKAGNSEARAQMIQGNLRLVLSVVQKFAGRGENLDDLFQVGCIGLIKAIDNFDPGLKVRFSTYGVPMIIGEIRRYLRDNSPIKTGTDGMYYILRKKLDGYTYFKHLAALQIMRELELMEDMQPEGFVIKNGEKKVELEHSQTFRRLQKG